MVDTTLHVWSTCVHVCVVHEIKDGCMGVARQSLVSFTFCQQGAVDGGKRSTFPVHGVRLTVDMP